MNVIRDKVGKVDLLIAVEDDVKVVGDSESGRLTKPTGLKAEIQDPCKKAVELIRAIAADVAGGMEDIGCDHRPSGLEIEFSLALSAEVGAWVLTGKTEAALKVKLSWENQSHGD